MGQLLSLKLEQLYCSPFHRIANREQSQYDLKQKDNELIYLFLLFYDLHAHQSGVTYFLEFLSMINAYA